MAGSFDDKGSGSGKAAKRPLPTIEGTATEVAVEPETDDAVSAKDDSAAAVEEKAEASADADAAPPKEIEPPEPAETPDQAPAPRNRGGGILSHLTAGLLGGLAGAAALAAAWSYLPADAPMDTPDIAPLEDRLAKLEAQPAAPDHSDALAALETQVAALEGRKPETPPELAALAERVGQLETSLNAMANAAQQGGSVADAAAISQQIGEAEERLEAKIEAKLAGTKGADAAAVQALQKEIAGLDAKLKALTEAELGSGEAAQLVPEIAVLDERLGKLESALPPLLAAVDREAEDTRAATLAIAFANLRAAVSEGRPYAAELATLAALSPGAGDLGGLLDYDDRGIPTVPELTRSFKVAKDAALAAAAPPAAGDSILDRLMASAESLIKIRRVDAEAEGDAPDAVLARAEAKLAEGDLAASVKEVETLQGAQAAAFTSWLDQAQARLGADATLQRLENILLVSLGGSGAPGNGQTDKRD